MTLSTLKTKGHTKNSSVSSTGRSSIDSASICVESSDGRPRYILILSFYFSPFVCSIANVSLSLPHCTVLQNLDSQCYLRLPETARFPEAPLIVAPFTQVRPANRGDSLSTAPAVHLFKLKTLLLFLKHDRRFSVNSLQNLVKGNCIKTNCPLAHLSCCFMYPAGWPSRTLKQKSLNLNQETLGHVEPSLKHYVRRKYNVLASSDVTYKHLSRSLLQTH